MQNRDTYNLLTIPGYRQVLLLEQISQSLGRRRPHQDAFEGSEGSFEEARAGENCGKC